MLPSLRHFRATQVILALLAALPGQQAVGDAQAATRTVNFIGVAQTRTNTTEVANSSTKAYCSIVIANNGANNQEITGITISEFSPGSSGGKTLQTSVTDSSGTESLTTIDTELLNTTGAATSCIGATLKKGGICLVQYVVSTLTWMGRIGYCSGTISVKDSSDSSPGSVVAGGSVFLNQETMVLGGILSGAYYASQTHVQSTDFGGNNLADDTVGDFTGNYRRSHFGQGSQNMNVFCQAACKAGNNSEWSDTECEEQCGYGTRSSGNDSGWTYHVGGFDREIDTGDTTMANAFYKDPDSAGADQGDVGHRQVYVQKGVANTHYAGGMVYEMVIGGLTGVCSGNRQFFEDGGTDFTHADGVDTHAWYYPADKSKYPPERLVCSHRHSRSDLFMRTGSTSPILVNGGNAF